MEAKLKSGQVLNGRGEKGYTMIFTDRTNILVWLFSPFLDANERFFFNNKQKKRHGANGTLGINSDKTDLPLIKCTDS